MKDTKSKLLAYVGGLGSGKTHVGAFKTIQMLMLNGGKFDGLALEPNFPLITQVMQPALEMALNQMKIPYEYKVSEKTFHLNINGNKCRLIMASAENWQRLIGLNLCFIWWDEMDTSKQELAEEAWPRLLGRLRVGTHRQLLVTSSPEGFKHTYNTFVVNKDKNGSNMVQACSLSNHFLPQDYFDTMYENYSKTQLDAWLYGRFVNLTSGSVYDFDRNFNHADINLDGSETEIYMAADFNQGNCVSIFSLFINGELYIYDEWVTKNTFETRDRLLQEYSNADIYCCADASGGRGTSVSDHEILKEHPGLVVVQGASNPSINESILAANAGFRNQHIWIDTKKIPKFADAIEQIPYDPKTNKPQKSTIHTGGSQDDRSDVLRYLCSYLIPLNLPQLQQRNQYT